MNDLLKFSNFALTREQMTKIKGGLNPNNCYFKSTNGGGIGQCDPGGGFGSCEWYLMMNMATKTCCYAACKTWS